MLGVCVQISCAARKVNFRRYEDDDDVHLYSAVTLCYCGMLGVLWVVNFEACCQWVLLSVKITRHYPTI